MLQEDRNKLFFVCLLQTRPTASTQSYDSELSIGNHMISSAIWNKLTTKCTHPTGSCTLWSLKNLPVLICTGNHMISSAIWNKLTTKCTHPTGSCTLWSLKNLPVLICTGNHMISSAIWNK